VKPRRRGTTVPNFNSSNLPISPKGEKSLVTRELRPGHGTVDWLPSPHHTLPPSVGLLSTGLQLKELQAIDSFSDSLRKHKDSRNSKTKDIKKILANDFYSYNKPSHTSSQSFIISTLKSYLPQFWLPNTTYLIISEKNYKED
jgi:hypothetical protein